VIDTHAHLQGLPEGPDAAIEAAAEAGVERIVCVGDSPELAREALELCERHAGLRTTAGLHPHRAEQWNARLRDELAELARDPQVVAIGECGLDFYRERAPHDVQARAFEGQVELAEETGKTLVIHTREAASETLAVLRGFEGRVVLHCFSLPDELDEVIERGWWTSFAGNVTYPSAAPLQEAARRVPVERLLVETDSPYLAPVPHRGRPCRPAMVLDTLRFIAGLRGVEPAELARAVVESADAAFALPA
jgi:TatD DNase family protein